MPLFAFLIGVTAGLRAMTPVAAISWAAYLGWLPLPHTPILVPIALSAAALGELINDKLPKTPSRKAPPAFVARMVMGGLTGAAVGSPAGGTALGAVLGVGGAVAGTLGGYEARKRLVKATGGKDLPIALLEDAIAVAAAFWIASHSA